MNTEGKELSDRGAGFCYELNVKSWKIRLIEFIYGV